jgi:hypothetical protein
MGNRMRLTTTFAAGLVLCSGAAISSGSNTIRAAMLTNLDAVPGLAGAKFANAQSGQVTLDNFGRVAFATTTVTPNSSGIWSEAVEGFSGSLNQVAIEGALTPGVSGGVFPSFSGTRIVGSDNGRLAFTQTLSLSGSPVGLWMLDGGDLGLFAYTGRVSPTVPAGLWNLNFITWPPAMTQDGTLALVTGFTVGSTNYLGMFQGNTSSNTMCSRTEPNTSIDGFTSFGSPQMNSAHEFSVPAAYRNAGGTRSGVFTGPCSGLTQTVIQQQLVPAYVGLPAGILFVSPTNLGLSDSATTFVTTISGSGVNAGNDTAIWSAQTGIYTLVAREGDQVPGLPPGCFYADFKNGSLVGPIVSASGHIAWAGNIFGASTSAGTNRVVMQRGTDGIVRVVTRTGDTPPDFPGTTTITALGSGLAMNSSGQLCFTATLGGQPLGRGSQAVLATDAAQQLTLLFESGQVQIVRPGVTATVGTLTSEPLVSGGSDGLPRNWNNRGEFAFRAGYSIAGGTSGYGLFVVGLPYCAADFNKDGFLDFSDFDKFVTTFEAGSAAGDFNGDGFLDFTDFDDFVMAFEAGC